MFAGAGKKPIATKQQKAVREETQGNQLPKQLSSDSLPVRQQHVKWVEIIYYIAIYSNIRYTATGFYL